MATATPARQETPFHYVALGDSTVAGHGASRPEFNYVSLLHARLREVYPRATVSNLGVGGATAADVARGQLGRAVALRPDLVTLSIGPNDITQGRDARAYERDITTIFETLRQETSAAIVASLLPDMTLAPIFDEQIRAYIQVQVDEHNAVLRRLGARYDVELVDLHTRSQQEVPGQQQRLLSADNYHPSDEGYARWAEVMWSGVERRVVG